MLLLHALQLVLQLHQLPIRNVPGLVHVVRVLLDMQVHALRKSLLGQSQERGIGVGVQVAQLDRPLVDIQRVLAVHDGSLGFESLDLEDLWGQCPAVFYVQVHVVSDTVQVRLEALEDREIVSFDCHVQGIVLGVLGFEQLQGVELVS